MGQDVKLCIADCCIKRRLADLRPAVPEPAQSVRQTWGTDTGPAQLHTGFPDTFHKSVNNLMPPVQWILIQRRHQILAQLLLPSFSWRQRDSLAEKPKLDCTTWGKTTSLLPFGNFILPRFCFGFFVCVCEKATSLMWDTCTHSLSARLDNDHHKTSSRRSSRVLKWQCTVYCSLS